MDRASVPTSTKAPCSGVSPRKRVMSPIESTPTTAQNTSSKKKNTLRMPMTVLRAITAHAATSSARQFNEDLLQLGLVHLEIAHLDALLDERPQQLRHPLLGIVHRALDPAVGLGAAQDTGGLVQPRRSRLQLERHHVAEPDLALEGVGGAAGQDSPGLDEADLVAQLLGLAHVVRGE